MSGIVVCLRCGLFESRVCAEHRRIHTGRCAACGGELVERCEFGPIQAVNEVSEDARMLMARITARLP